MQTNNTIEDNVYRTDFKIICKDGDKRVKYLVQK